MNQSVTERPISGMSPAATDGGAKRHRTRRVVRRVLVAIDTCVHCGQRKAEFETAIGHGHHRELVRVCGPCFQKVPLQQIAARVFGKRRAQVVIATKGGNFNDEAGQWQKTFTGPFLAGKVEDSLRRLRTDYIDLYQLHTPRNDEEYRQALGSAETLDRLIEQGKLRAYGLSIGPVEHGLRQIGDGFGATIQVVYNALERGPEEKLLPAAKEANYGVIPRVPLASGFLTGKYTDDARFDKQDHRSRLTAEQKKDWVEKVNRLKPIAKEVGLTMTQLALQYILASSAVSVVIPGARNADQARQNAAVGKLSPLSDAVVKRIRQAVE